MTTTNEERLEVDYSERSGFLTGKSAAIADWINKREDAKYREIFRKLYNRKWWKEHPEYNRERAMAYYHEHRDEVLRKRRAKHFLLNPIKVLKCKMCVNMCTGDYRVYCSRSCVLAYRRSRDSKGKNQKIAGKVIDVVHRFPGSNVKEIREMAGTKVKSTGVLLCRLVRKGVLRKEKGTRFFVYFIAGE